MKRKMCFCERDIFQRAALSNLEDLNAMCRDCAVQLDSHGKPTYFDVTQRRIWKNRQRILDIYQCHTPLDKRDRSGKNLIENRFVPLPNHVSLTETVGFFLGYLPELVLNSVISQESLDRNIIASMSEVRMVYISYLDHSLPIEGVRDIVTSYIFFDGHSLFYTI